MRSMQEKRTKLIIEGTEAKIETTEELEESYLKNQYKQAFQRVKEILRQNQKDGERNREQIQNIIPFIGKRGSGKTSAMMSFSGVLKRYSKEYMRYDPIFENGNAENLKPKFFCLECIDSSLLEKGEDIFKVILAQMYGEFLKLDQNGRPRDGHYEYEKRELQQKFDKVYRSVCKLERENLKEMDYEESSITSLTNLSSSLELVQEFRGLVQKYLKLLFEEREQNPFGSQSFLVITVDDLDLNIYKGFDMLEKLHRYMMMKNVIIMVSLDYDQMKLLCEKQFYSMVPQFDKKLAGKNRYIEKISMDFLDKVLPGNIRIYMPLFKRMENLEVCRNKEEEGKDTKSALFELLYKKIGFKLDVEGTKRHFYEQNSLRTFVSFYLMLDRMKSVKDISEKEERIFQHNYEILMFDTLNRMKDERLNEEHRALFTKLTEVDLLHSVKDFYFEISKYSTEENEELSNLIQNIKINGYSYGEILRIVYCFGRVSSENKEFVRCLLAYYSLEFYKEYYELCIGKEEKRELFSDLINGSVVGSWANEIVPGVQVVENTVGDAKHIGMVPQVLMSEILKQFQFTVPIESEDRKQKIEKYIKSSLVLLMFFENPNDRKKLHSWGVKKRILTKNQRKLKLLEEQQRSKESGVSFGNKKIEIKGEGKADFNVFNFVSNAFHYETNIRPLIKDLCDVFLEDEREEDREAMGEVIVCSFDKEFKDWKEKSNGFAIPVYDVDITYNLVKRLRYRNQDNYDVQQEEFWSELIKIYEFVFEKLKQNDEWYKKIDEESNFADCFIECPYMKWIFEKKDDGTLQKNYREELVDEFGKCFEKMISIIIRERVL